MSKPASTVTIGAFVVGAFLILFALLFLLSGDIFNRNTDKALVVFDGSLKGLNVGAPVAFKGVQIGEVVGFDVVVDSDTYEVMTPVLLRVEKGRVTQVDDGKEVREDVPTGALIERGMRAQLQLQSLLTGLLYVQLDFHPGTPERFGEAELRERYDIDEDYIIVPTIPTDLERLTRSLQEVDFGELAKDIRGLLNGIDRIVNDEDLQALPERASAMMLAIEELSRRLEGEVNTLSPDLQTLVTEAGGTMKTLNQDMPELTAGAEQAMEDLSVTLETAQQALKKMEYLLSDDSPMIYDLRKAAEELGAAGRSLQSLAETLETQPESILKGIRQ
ncbi:MAG: MlaD family protein [Halieaceae bacterium]|nr:MlaD family protein [Halieaceae bacterium]